MSLVNTAIIKQPLKVIEVPLSKFNEEVIPHHQKIFEQHKVVVLKLLSQNTLKAAQQEVRMKRRTIKQLKDLLYELDTLRTQVEDSDLDKFDGKTLCLRKAILTLITSYGKLDKMVSQRALDEEEARPEPSSAFEGTSQIQLTDNLDEIKLREHQNLLNIVETINRDTEDLQEMFTQLNEMVESQAQDVDHIEESVESAHNNVQSGLKHLTTAHRLKTAAYPITGAVLGGIIGGPIGLLAGLKVGGIAAVGCAVAGYTGGKMFKKNHIEEAPVDNNPEVVHTSEPHKKNI